jgi:hypothetical protein
VTRDVANLRIALLISMCLALLTGVDCKPHPQGQSSPFPASNEIDGWAKSGEIRTFPAEDLWKYIDGEAERYLKAGAQTASTSDYKFQGKFDAVVDVYTMRTPVGASQIVESEPLGDAKLVELGDGARLYKGSLVFRKGPYLVRITAYEDSAETQQALLSLGRGINQRLAE